MLAYSLSKNPRLHVLTEYRSVSASSRSIPATPPPSSPTRSSASAGDSSSGPRGSTRTVRGRGGGAPFEVGAGPVVVDEEGEGESPGWKASAARTYGRMSFCTAARSCGVSQLAVLFASAFAGWWWTRGKGGWRGQRAG